VNVGTRLDSRSDIIVLAGPRASLLTALASLALGIFAMERARVVLLVRFDCGLFLSLLESRGAPGRVTGEVQSINPETSSAPAKISLNRKSHSSIDMPLVSGMQKKAKANERARHPAQTCTNLNKGRRWNTGHLRK
jgi:hypothetical protein